MFRDNLDLLILEMMMQGKRLSSFNEWKAPVDIYTTDEGAYFEFALVGVNPNDNEVEVSTTNDSLNVTYKSNNEQFDGKYYQRGIKRQDFDYSWKISRKLDLTKLDIKFENGLLRIFIPLSEKAKPKTWKIN